MLYQAINRRQLGGIKLLGDFKVVVDAVRIVVAAARLNIHPCIGPARLLLQHLVDPCRNLALQLAKFGGSPFKPALIPFIADLDTLDLGIAIGARFQLADKILDHRLGRGIHAACLQVEIAISRDHDDRGQLGALDVIQKIVDGCDTPVISAKGTLLNIRRRIGKIKIFFRDRATRIADEFNPNTVYNRLECTVFFYPIVMKQVIGSKVFMPDDRSTYFTFYKLVTRLKRHI